MPTRLKKELGLYRLRKNSQSNPALLQGLSPKGVFLQPVQPQRVCFSPLLEFRLQPAD
jgi:hypothetical protein